MIPVLLGSAQQADAASLTLDDSVENQITTTHGQFEGGGSSNGDPPSANGVNVIPGEFSTFTGQWIDLGASTARSDVFYFTDTCTGLVSDILRIDVTPSGASGLATFELALQSSPDGSDLGPVPAGVTGIPEPSPADPFQFSAPFLLGRFFSDEIECPIGGEIIPIESSALMLAGLQTSAIWMLPVLAGAVGVGTFYIKSRINKD
jgi:hypothetical protein